jgi:hypothetical protein
MTEQADLSVVMLHDCDAGDDVALEAVVSAVGVACPVAGVRASSSECARSPVETPSFSGFRIRGRNAGGRAAAPLVAALLSVRTQWVSLLTACSRPRPDWYASSRNVIRDCSPAVYAFGGPVLRLRGTRTAARWLDPLAPVARFDRLRRPRDRTGDLPVGRRRHNVAFLSQDNLIVRTDVALAAVQALGPRAPYELGPAICAAAHHAGGLVVYDSELRMCVQSPFFADTKSALDLEGRAAFDDGYYSALMSSIPTTLGLSLFHAMVGTRSAPGLTLGVAMALRKRRVPMRMSSTRCLAQGIWIGSRARARGATRSAMKMPPRT